MSLEDVEFPHSPVRDKLVGLVAQRTGVDAASVKAVLRSLGIDQALEEVARGNRKDHDR